MTTLYFGIDKSKGEGIHLPLIETKALEVDPNIVKTLFPAGVLILTSPRTVFYFKELLKRYALKLPKDTVCLAIGKSTEESLLKLLSRESILAKYPTQEGVLETLLEGAWNGPFLYPHSALARPFLREHLSLKSFPLYTTVSCKVSLPCPWEEVKKLIFTSPSTVTSFKENFPNLSLKGKDIITQGPITKQKLKNTFVL